MTPILVHLTPFDLIAGARFDLTVADAAEATAYGLGGVRWHPAITQRPVMALELMSPDLDGKVLAGRASVSINTSGLGLGAKKVKWVGSAAHIYSAKDLQWPGVTEFSGEVIESSVDLDNDLVSLTLEVSTDFLEGPMLFAEFDGSGGLGGEADKRGTLCPAGFGVVENIEPVWFDTTTWIGMIDGYNNTLAITRLMEGLDDRGPRVGNYANYAALKNAIDTGAIKPGQWGTCVAQGLVGLGAPPAAPIGVNATFGANRVGAIMKRILLTHREVDAENVDDDAFDAIDAILPYDAFYWLKDQRDCKDLLEALACSVNSTPLVTFQKKVTITRGVIAAPVETLDRSGKQKPRVIDSKATAFQKPVWRLRARTARPASVLTYDQVLYEDTIEDKGLYSNTATYRAGHIVWLADKSSWLYQNATPGSGNPPPVWPIDENAHWRNMTPPATASDLTYADGTPIEALKPGEAGANITESRTAAAILGQGPGATAGAPLIFNSYVGPGQNLIPVSDQVPGPIFQAGYNPDGLNIDYAWWVGDSNPAGWTTDNYVLAGAMKSFLIHQTGRVDPAPYGSADFPNYTPGLGIIRIPVIPGEEIIASLYYAGHRCGARLTVVYTDAAGAYVNSASVDDPTATDGSANRLSLFRRIHLKSTVPAGAVGVNLIPGKLNTNIGYGDSYCWIAAPMLERAADDQTQPSPYMSGPTLDTRMLGFSGELDSDRTAIHTAAAIAGQGALATQNAANWLTQVIGSGKPANNAGTTLRMYENSAGSYLITGNRVEKLATSAWDYAAYSSEFTNGTAMVSAKLDGNGTFIGLTSGAGAGTYPNLDFGIHWSGGGTIGIYELGVWIGDVLPNADYSNNEFAIVYNGDKVNYYIDGNLLRTSNARPGLKMRAGVAIYPAGGVVSNIKFGPGVDQTQSFLLTAFGTGSTISGNTMTKTSGTHALVEGGAVGVPQKNTAFVSCSLIYATGFGGGWVSTCGLDPVSKDNVPTNGVGVWRCQMISGGATSTFQILKSDVVVDAWTVPAITRDSRIALIYNGRRIFAMYDGTVYGGHSSAYDVAAGTVFWPKVWDYHRTDGNGESGGYRDIRYGAWSDARTYLDDGYTILNQSGFKTDEGTSAAVSGQGPWATTQEPVSSVFGPNPNLLFNGGFKLGLIGWGQWRSDPGMSYWSISGGNGEGPMIYINAANGNTTVLTSNEFNAYQGYSYTVQLVALAGAQTGGKTFVRITYKDGGGAVTGYGAGVVIPNNGAWLPYKITTVAPAGTVKAVVEVVGESLTLGGGGAVYVRQIKVHGAGANFLPFTDEATYSAMYGDGTSLDLLKPAEGGANVTGSHTAAAILGQGILATLNYVDLSTTQVLPRGSVPPTLANNGFTYTSNTNSITVTWPTMVVYRSDATTISISSGSRAITGLSAGTTYRIYPFIADTGGSSATMDFVTGVSPAFGSPGVLYSNSSPNVAAASQMYYYNRIPMGNFALATTTSGGGGGGGGGGWNCLHEDMLLCQRPAGETEEGTAVSTPEHEGCSLAIISRVERHRCSRWIEIYAGDEMIAKVTERHLFYRAADMSPIPARDVRLGDLLRAEGDHVEVTGLRLCTRTATAIGIDIGEPHLHYAGPRRLVCHNGTAKP